MKELQSTEDESIRHIPKYGGHIWFVNKSSGSNANDGTTPDKAFETIGTALSACSSGDAIQIKAGTYTEVGLDVNKEAVELWFELGVDINPATGTTLTVSSNFCNLKGPHKITAVAGQVGILISGNNCTINETKVAGGTSSMQITGSGCIITDCAAGAPTAIGFDIQGSHAELIDCRTIGNAATYGFKINNNVDSGILRNCYSTGNSTSGFYVATGSTNWTISDCFSGGGDGINADIDNANVWSNFSFDDRLFKSITFTDATQAFDLFTITGTVEIESIHGHVIAALNAEMGNCMLRIYGTDGTTDSDLTTAASCNSLPIGSFIGKTATSGDTLTVASSAAPVVIENTNFKEPRVSTIIVADNTGTTTVQFYSDDGAGNKDGQIHFHCVWKPVSDDGWVSPS